MYVGGIIFREMSFSSPRVIVPIHKLQLLLFEVRRLLGTRGIGKGGEDGPMSVKQPPPQGPHGCFSGVWNFPYAQPSCRQFSCRTGVSPISLLDRPWSWQGRATGEL